MSILKTVRPGPGNLRRRGCPLDVATLMGALLLFAASLALTEAPLIHGPGDRVFEEVYLQR